MEIPENLKWINKIEEIDVAEGIKNCGMPQHYHKFVRSFYDTIETRIQDIQDSYNSDDIKTYTSKVHSLKSVAGIMGAKELSELARELEEAGDYGDRQFIDQNTETIINMLHAFKDKLSPIEIEDTAVGAEDNKPMISPEEMESAYRALGDFVQQMDYDAAERVFSELNEYILPDNDRQLIKELEKTLRSFNWDGMESMLSQR